MCHMLRYCPVYYYSSLRIVIIPFLYDLKGAFDSIQMKGQRLFLTGKMTGQTLFLKKKMTGQGLFSREKMKGQGLFSRRKNTVCPAHVPIIFAPSLTHILSLQLCLTDISNQLSVPKYTKYIGTGKRIKVRKMTNS